MDDAKAAAVVAAAEDKEGRGSTREGRESAQKTTKNPGAAGEAATLHCYRA